MAKIITKFMNVSFILEQNDDKLFLTQEIDGQDPQRIEVSDSDFFNWCLHEHAWENHRRLKDRVTQLIQNDYDAGIHLYDIEYKDEEKNDYKDVFIRSKILDPSIAVLRQMDPRLTNVKITNIADCTYEPIDEYMDGTFIDYENWPILEN